MAHGVYPPEPVEAGSWRVFSNGTCSGTKIIDPHGDEVLEVKSLYFTIDSDDSGVGTLNLDIAPVSIAVVSDQPNLHFKCPACLEVLAHVCKPPDTGDDGRDKRKIGERIKRLGFGDT